jgi:P pilus assembly chaperone PapD
MMKIEQMRKLILGAGVGLATTVFSTLPTLAQNFTVSPMVTIAEARAGQIKSTININNQGNEPLRVRVYGEDFRYDKTKGFVSIPTHDRSALTYVQFSPRELVVPPGVTRNVRIGAILPPSLPDGEYRAVIFVEDLKERNIKESSGNAIVIKARVASVFFLSKGASKSELQISAASWDNIGKKLNIVVKNNGNQTSYPDINWEIKKDGKEIATNQIKGILVQSQNERETILNGGEKLTALASGNYILSGEIINGKNPKTPFTMNINIP